MLVRLMILIRGKVAAIKGDYAVVINRGYKDGVEEDMKFIIYEEGDEIHDPDTTASLGKLEYIKAKVKVINPSEKFSWAETYETHVVPGTGPTALASAVAVMGQFAPIYERARLPLDATTSSSIGGPVAPKVRVGDLVRQIID